MRSRTDEKIVKAAVKMYNSGATAKDVAKKFNVSQPTIYNWAKGKIAPKKPAPIDLSDPKHRKFFDKIKRIVEAHAKRLS